MPAAVWPILFLGAGVFLILRGYPKSGVFCLICAALAVP